MKTCFDNKIPPEAVHRLVDLNACITYLKSTNNLLRVTSPVDPVHELAGVSKQLEGGKCVLFENVKGSKFPVLMGLLWNRSTVGSLFASAPEEVPFIIAEAIGSWRSNPHTLSSPIRDKAPANEIIEETVDLSKLPVPVHALKDGGHYLDSSVVIVRNPINGVPNISIHRMMIKAKNRLTFLIDPGRHLGAYLSIMEERGEPLEVTINNGVGLAPWFASVLPQQGDGKNGIANHLLNRPIEFINAQSVDVPAYADAQFVIEAEILPHVREKEGPFAEVTGYYALAENRRVMNVKAITRRKNPVFHSLLSGKELWNAVGFTAEAKIFFTVKEKVPQLKCVYLSPGGCGFYGAVVQVAKDRQDVGRTAIEETFRAFDPLQWVIAVDTDVNIYDPVDVDWAMTTRFNPDKDLIVLKNQSGHILNPMVTINPDGSGGTVTKMGIDATAPYPAKQRFERVSFLHVDLKDYEIEG